MSKLMLKKLVMVHLLWLGALCTFFQFYRFFAPLRLHRDIMGGGGKGAH